MSQEALNVLSPALTDYTFHQNIKNKNKTSLFWKCCKTYWIMFSIKKLCWCWKQKLTKAAKRKVLAKSARDGTKGERCNRVAKAKTS